MVCEVVPNRKMEYRAQPELSENKTFKLYMMEMRSIQLLHNPFRAKEFQPITLEKITTSMIGMDSCQPSITRPPTNLKYREVLMEEDIKEGFIARYMTFWAVIIFTAILTRMKNLKQLKERTISLFKICTVL